MTLPNFLEYSQKSDETVWLFNKANKRKVSAVANDNVVSPWWGNKTWKFDIKQFDTGKITIAKRAQSSLILLSASPSSR